MKVGDLVKHIHRGMNGIIITMPPPNERHGAVLVQWFDLMMYEWCSQFSIGVVSEHKGDK